MPGFGGPTDLGTSVAVLGQGLVWGSSGGWLREGDHEELHRVGCRQWLHVWIVWKPSLEVVVGVVCW